MIDELKDVELYELLGVLQSASVDEVSAEILFFGFFKNKYGIGIFLLICSVNARHELV